jgi:hypothetical protein
LVGQLNSITHHFKYNTYCTMSCVTFLQFEHWLWQFSWLFNLTRPELLIGCCRMLSVVNQFCYFSYSVILFGIGKYGGNTVAQWLRHCAINQKVARSIPDGVIGIFHWHNPSGRTMALGSTQPLTEMSTRNISLGVKAAGV